jgi:hypothetical protein
VTVAKRLPRPDWVTLIVCGVLSMLVLAPTASAYESPTTVQRAELVEAAQQRAANLPNTATISLADIRVSRDWAYAVIRRFRASGEEEQGIGAIFQKRPSRGWSSRLLDDSCVPASASVPTAVVADLQLAYCRPRFFLRRNYAASLMEEALTRRDGLHFAQALDPRVLCAKRLGARRLKCGMDWALGDWFFYGSGTIWITYNRGQPIWNFSYRVVRKNEYCASVQHGAHCSRVFRKR